MLCEVQLQLIMFEHSNCTEQNSGITRTKLNVNRRFKRNVHVEIITITDLADTNFNLVHKEYFMKVRAYSI